jgi:dTDP-glucose 4,6-dehydratase
VTAFARDTNEWTRPRVYDSVWLGRASEDGFLRIVYGDLNGDISGLCEHVDAIIHFAARTFVDHSIKDPTPFVQANTIGTANMLEEARRQNVRCFINVSTDEVYGQILEGAYKEDAPLCPRNPYSASKAGADALAISYFHTFGMWTAVTRTENNYGPYQHPQKAIPVFVGKALRDEPLPIYGDGEHVRQWLHVQDHIQALLHILDKREELPGGEVWHVAGSQELTNNQLAARILARLKKPANLVKHIDDFDIRPGHDRRYALNCDKLIATGWAPRIELAEGLDSCVDWYSNHRSWLG